MIHREVLMFDDFSSAYLLAKFDFFNDYDDTCGYLRRMIARWDLEGTAPDPGSYDLAEMALEGLEATYPVWLKNWQNAGKEEEDEPEAWILWVGSMQSEAYATREDAEEDLAGSESRGCRGLIYDDLEALKRDQKTPDTQMVEDLSGRLARLRKFLSQLLRDKHGEPTLGWRVAERLLNGFNEDGSEVK